MVIEEHKFGTGTGTETFIKPSMIYIRILTLLIRQNYKLGHR
jgi:hypothetical protein